MRSTYVTYSKWKAWSDDHFGRYGNEDAVYFKHELKLVGLRNVRGLRILEIGFGNGQFAKWAQDNGASWAGTEAQLSQVEAARARGWTAFEAAADFTRLAELGAFDLVVAFDVFEHLDVESLLDLMIRLRDVLAPGGRIVGRVPSGDSPFSGAIQRGDLTHKLALGSAAVRQLAQSVDLEVIQVREPAFPVRGVGPRSASRRVLVKGMRAVVFPIIRLAFMGDERVVLSPNMIFVLGRHPKAVPDARAQMFR